MATFNEKRAHDVAITTLKYLLNNPGLNGIEDNTVNIDILQIYDDAYKSSLEYLNRNYPDSSV